MKKEELVGIIKELKIIWDTQDSHWDEDMDWVLSKAIEKIEKEEKGE